MNYHNTDVAACNQDSCKFRLSCLRWWLGTNKDPHQVWENFPLDEDKDDCAGYVNYEPLKIEKHSKKKESKKRESKGTRSDKDLKSEILIAADKYAADEKDPNIAIVKTMDFANGAEWAFDLMKKDIVAYKRVCKKLLIDDICSKIREL